MKARTWQTRLPDREEDPLFERMNSSVSVDMRLLGFEIASARAHATVLADAGVYGAGELATVLSALDRIPAEVQGGAVDPMDYEDVHSLVEHRLTEIAGIAGAKIQTARSRNEQTATAQRLYMKEAAAELASGVLSLIEALHDKASANLDAVMPGYTHARPAQPVRFSFYLASHIFGLARDRARFLGALSRLDQCPAGSGALAGATFGIDRAREASLLGFSEPSQNALDSVSDRDMQTEIVSHAAILMVRLSRMAEDFILWSSPAFGFLALGDTYCTSSSLMPQKKNPDGLELVRGKAARVAGDLVSMIVLCKGLPTGYQKDLQEDKERMFDAVDTALACLALTAGVVRGMTVDAAAMKAAVGPECSATDLADDLVKSGMAFRDAYSEVASRFASAGAAGARIPPEESVERRRSAGGTALAAVVEQLRAASRLIGKP